MDEHLSFSGIFCVLACRCDLAESERNLYQEGVITILCVFISSCDPVSVS